jgi:hypothetical protein
MINVELMKVTSIINGKAVTQTEEKTMEITSPHSCKSEGCRCYSIRYPWTC